MPRKLRDLALIPPEIQWERLLITWHIRQSLGLCDEITWEIYVKIHRSHPGFEAHVELERRYGLDDYDGRRKVFEETLEEMTEIKQGSKRADIPGAIKILRELKMYEIDTNLNAAETELVREDQEEREMILKSLWKSTEKLRRFCKSRTSSGLEFLRPGPVGLDFDGTPIIDEIDRLWQVINNEGSFRQWWGAPDGYVYPRYPSPDATEEEAAQFRVTGGYATTEEAAKAPLTREGPGNPHSRQSLTNMLDTLAIVHVPTKLREPLLYCCGLLQRHKRS